MDAASGFCVSAKSLSNIFVSFTFEFMMNSSLQIHGTIWYFSALTFLGFFFCLFFVRETRGLTDLEKKSIYSPKAIEKDHKSIELHQSFKDKAQKAADKCQE